MHTNLYSKWTKPLSAKYVLWCTFCLPFFCSSKLLKSVWKNCLCVQSRRFRSVPYRWSFVFQLHYLFIASEISCNAYRLYGHQNAMQQWRFYYHKKEIGQYKFVCIVDSTNRRGGITNISRSEIEYSHVRIVASRIITKRKEEKVFNGTKTNLFSDVQNLNSTRKISKFIHNKHNKISRQEVQAVSNLVVKTYKSWTLHGTCAIFFSLS